MEDRAMNRRQFMLAMSASAGALALSGGIPAALAAEAPVHTGFAPYVRRNINSFTPAQIADLRAAVGVMKSLPVSNPASWWFQANMHGKSPVAAGDNVTWNTCQHGSFFFLSWHRMYVYYFERILRAASPSKQLTLPYWAYSPTANRSLPSPYITASAGNSLYVANRNPGINAGGMLPASALTWCLASQRIPFIRVGAQPPSSSFGGGIVPGPTHFASAYGQLELLPHNTVHSTIGGLMGNPMTAAQDPIFWAHHANVDRLWQGWLALGGGRVNPTSAVDGGAQWRTQTFKFYDENGTLVQLSGAQVVNTAGQLNYVYDVMPTPPCPVPVAQVHEPRIFTAPHLPGPGPVEAAARSGPVTLAAGPTTLRVAVPAQLRATQARAAAATRVELRLEGVHVARNPGVLYHVFVNLPANEADRALRNAAADGHYVGTIDFFEIVSHQHGGGAGYDVALDLGPEAPVLRRAVAAGDVTVTFVPEGLELPGGRRMPPQATVQMARVVLRSVPAGR